METLSALFSSIRDSVLTELVIVALGYLFAVTVLRWYKNWKYGGWHAVLLTEEGDEVLDRPLSPTTAERVLSDDAELNVYLKGLISPYGRIHCDLVSELQKPNPKLIDKVNSEGSKRFVIHLLKPYITPESYAPLSIGEDTL